MFSIEISYLRYIQYALRNSTCPKSQDKNLNILRTRRAFKMK